MYGKDWRAMVPLIKTRSLRQIRTHAQKVLKSMYTKRNVPQSSSVSDTPVASDKVVNGSEDVNINVNNTVSVEMREV